MRNEGIGSWPARRARLSPDAPALIHEGQSRSFAEVDRRVTRLANALRDQGVGAGDRVAYLGPNHPAFLETLFATTSLGAILVPLNTRLSGAELGYILTDSGTRLLVYGPQSTEVAAAALERAPDVGQVVALTAPRAGELDFEELVAAGASDRVDVRVTHADVCMIMYTSGTTGQPKGAMITHGNVTFNCANVLVDLDLRRDEVTLVSAPMFHTAALNMTCLPTFLKGGAAVIMAAFTPDRAFDLIEVHGVTWMFGVPAMFAAMADAQRWPDADLSTVRILECGGAPVPESLIRTYQARGLTFLQGYGMTECSPGVLFLGAESADRVGSAGKPSFFTDVRLAAPDGRDPAPGEPGEVLVSGPNVMKGYWGRPEATAESIRDGWFHSGDAAVADADGFFHVVDRFKDMFISGGENVYPAEVERLLAAHPDVADCAVVGVPDEKWGEVGKAFVVPRGEAPPDPAELLGFLDGELARYKIPKHVIFVDQIPRNAAGKAQKHRLPRP